jgi:hypothetical protein
MIRQMKSVTLNHVSGQTQDAYGNLTDSITTKSIPMAISTISGSKQTHYSILTEDSTHIGLTTYTDITSADTITDNSATYTIDYIIPARYTQLFLRLVQ